MIENGLGLLYGTVPNTYTAGNIVTIKVTNTITFNGSPYATIVSLVAIFIDNPEAQVSKTCTDYSLRIGDPFSFVIDDEFFVNEDDYLVEIRRVDEPTYTDA